MSEEQIVTPAWIAAVRQNYGLDTRTAFEAGQVWGEHGVMAGAVTALGHALDRVEVLEREIETERMRLAACGVAARGGAVRNILPAYCTDSLQAVDALVVQKDIAAKRLAAVTGLKAEKAAYDVMVNEYGRRVLFSRLSIRLALEAARDAAIDAARTPTTETDHG